MNNKKTSNKEAKRLSSTQYTVVVAPAPLTVSGEVAECYYRPSFVKPFQQMIADKVSPKMYQYSHFVLQTMYDVANKQNFKYKHPLGCELNKWECVFSTTYFTSSIQGRYQFDAVYDKTGVTVDKARRQNDTARAIKLLIKYGLIAVSKRFATRERNKRQYIVYSLKKTCGKGEFQAIDLDNVETYQRDVMIKNVLSIEENAKHIGMNKEEYKTNGKVNIVHFAESASKRIDSLKEDVELLKRHEAQQDDEIAILKDDAKAMKIRLRKLEERLAKAEQENEMREQFLNTIVVRISFNDGRN